MKDQTLHNIVKTLDDIFPAILFIQSAAEVKIAKPTILKIYSKSKTSNWATKYEI